MTENQQVESFAQLLEEHLQHTDLRPGAVVNATIIDIRAEHVLVDAGLKHSCVVKGKIRDKSTKKDMGGGYAYVTKGYCKNKPTKKGIAEGYAYRFIPNKGYSFWLWNIEKVCELLKSYGLKML